MSDNGSHSKAGAATASLWSGLDILLRQGIQFAVSIVLARLLLPEEFGVVAIVSFFIALANILAQGGLGIALVQNHHTTHDQENAVFWLNAILCMVFAGILAVSAGALARFYQEPELELLLLGGAVIIFISNFGAVPNAMLTRELAFRRVLKLGLLATIASAICGIVLAFRGFGPWALLAMAFTSTAVHALGIWFVHPWRPSLRIKLSDGRPLFGFGLWVGLSGMLDTAYTQGFSLLIGKLHGLAAVGFYNRGANTQQLPTGLLSTLIARVALPIFSARGGDKAAVERGMKLALGLVMFINLPMMVGMAMTAPLIIETLFGARWLPASPVLTILSLAGILYPVHLITLQVILSQGNSTLFFRLELQKKAVAIACIVIGSFYGIVGLAWSQVAASILALLFTAYPAGRTIGFGWVGQMLDLRNLGVPLLGMIGAVSLSSTMLIDWDVQFRTLLVIGSGALAYLATAWISKNPYLAQALALFREMRSSAKPAG